VRSALYAAAALAGAACAPATARAILVDTASILFECLPFLALSAIFGGAGAYAGCGCGGGPSARSLPAALAAAALFGWPAAIARFCSAVIFARLARAHDRSESKELLEALVGLVPAALLAATIALYAPLLSLRGLSPALAFIAGLALGAAASPCALGGVALAASLRVLSPLAAAGVLCTAGVIDIYAFGILHACDRLRHRRGPARSGARASALHDSAGPRRTLLPGTLAAALIVAVVLGAPAPVYRATETTLTDAFPGERVNFTGVAVAERGASALVRYAILCCRADASPVTLAVDRDLRGDDGRWLRADGVLARTHDGSLRLRVQTLERVAPPSDPFVYR